MWGLWFFPLAGVYLLLFVAGLVAALIWHFSRPKNVRGSVLKALSVPIGCGILPVALVALLISIFALFEKSDSELYEEVFGYAPEITEDRMLFDDFESDTGRVVFMRAEPTDDERRQLLSVPGLRESSQQLESFSQLGRSRGIGGWWISTDVSGEYCKTAKMHRASGFNGWTELYIAECFDAGTEWQHAGTVEDVYVIAERWGN